MTDLRTLLHDAAPEPTRTVDVDGLLERAATRRRWPRLASYFAALVAAVAVANGAGHALAPADPAEVRTLPAEETTTVPPSPLVERGPEPAAATGSTTAPTTPRLSPTTTTASSRADASAAADDHSCHVIGSGNGEPGSDRIRASTPDGDDPSFDEGCAYRSRAVQGFRGTGSWYVQVKPEDPTKPPLRYDSQALGDTCLEDVIHPGDWVQAYVGDEVSSTITVDADVSC